MKKRILPRYAGGKSKYNIKTNDGTIHNFSFDEQGNTVLDDGTVGSQLLDNVIVRPRRYSSAFDGNQEYLDDMIGFVPIAGDLNDGLNAATAAYNGDYLLAGMLGAGLLLPNVLEKPIKYGRRALRNVIDYIPSRLMRISASQMFPKTFGTEIYDINTLPGGLGQQIKDFYEKDVFPRHINVDGNRSWDGLKRMLDKTQFRFVDLPKRTAKGFFDPLFPNRIYINKKYATDPLETFNILIHELEHKERRGNPFKYNPFKYNTAEIEALSKPYIFSNNSKYSQLARDLQLAETGATNRLLRAYLSQRHPGLLSNKPVYGKELDEYINNLDDTFLLDALSSINSYGEEFAQHKYPILTKDALKYVPGLVGGAVATSAIGEYKNGKASGIHIKPQNRGKFTALKKRTGHSASWFKAHGTPALKKMATFALNSRKWHHK